MVGAWLAGHIRGALELRGHCDIALAGGRSPRAAYQSLARRALRDELDWRNVHIYFGDERAVPPTDPQSNFHMASESLIQLVAIPPANVHRLEADRADLDAAAAAYAAELPAQLDVLVLGMGADGHTASLFPGAAALREQQARVVLATAPVPPVMRLTITPPVISAARQVCVLVSGRDKAGTILRVVMGDEDASALPVLLARRGTWFLDQDAASLLPHPGAA